MEKLEAQLAVSSFFFYTKILASGPNSAERTII